MMLAGGVMLLSLALGGAVDGAEPSTPPPLPPPPARSYRSAESERPAPSVEALEPPRAWYGWQLLVADAASFTLGVAGKTGATTVGATLGFTLAAPALHFAHGDHVTAGVSLLVRASMVGVVAATVASVDPSCHDDLCKKTLDDVMPQLLFLACGAAFVIVDDTVLSRADAPVRPGTEEQARRSGSSLALAPTLAPTSGGMSMGLAGRF
jgi:hypothetical protein